MNNVEIQGRVCSKIPGYIFIDARRTSGISDIIPVKNLHADINERVHIIGRLKTRNFVDANNVRHKEMYVECTSMMELEGQHDINTVRFDGYICKKEVLRSTPNGRTILDFTAAINENSSSSYISCIIWSKAAKWLSELDIGTKVYIAGRFQSREYTKNDETKIAYEISVNNIRMHRS